MNFTHHIQIFSITDRFKKLVLSIFTSFLFMAEEQQDLSPEEQQQIQLVCDGIKKYIENMAIPDDDKQDYLTGMYNKYKDNPAIF